MDEGGGVACAGQRETRWNQMEWKRRNGEEKECGGVLLLGPEDLKSSNVGKKNLSN